jgi:hypothetical protein
MEPSFVATRVTNPSGKKGVKKMARKRVSRDSKGRYVKRTRRSNPSRKRKSNPSRKRKTIKRRSNPRKRSMTRRKRNPNLKIGGVAVKPAVIQGLGVAAGAYLGQRVTDFVGSNVLSLLPASMRGIGYAAGGVGTLMLGEALQKKAKDLPITAAMAAISVPMWIQFFRSIGLMSSGMAAGEMSGSLWGRMKGSIQPGRMPGGMGATIQPGKMPGGGMGATIQSGAIPGMGRSGGFGGLLS